MDSGSNSQEFLGEDCGEERVVGNKTPVSLFQEFCTAFNLGTPLYNKIDESGEAHEKTFRMSLIINSLGIEEIAEARTIMQAKHNAANKMMNHIKEVAATGKTLNNINHDTLLKCSDWLTIKQKTLQEDSPTSEMKKSAGSLTEWALTRNEDPPEYETISASGPPHNRKFVMTCKMKGHVTQGEGKSKKIAKHDAAEKMLHILESMSCVGSGENSEENLPV